MMKTPPNHTKLDDSSRCCSVSLAETVKTAGTDATEPTTADDCEGSDEELDLEGLDELEKDLLNWAEKKKPKTKSPSSKAGTLSTPTTPIRKHRKKKVMRTKSAGAMPRQQKAYENRLKRAMTLNTFEQEKKKEDSAKVETAEENSQHPDERLKQLLHGVSAKTFQSETWENYFTAITPERVAAHSIEVSKAIRKDKLDKLRQLHAEGVPLDTCNHHGESMIHLACRLSKFEMVKFLVEEAKASVRVRDDVGRTPLHDACWTPNPDFQLIQFILNKSPELLFINDNRGFTALRYIPQSCWDEWCAFFEDSLSFLRLKINHSEFLNAHCQLDDAQERLQALMRRVEQFS